jgi:hypothetical protein
MVASEFDERLLEVVLSLNVAAESCETKVTCLLH